MAATNDSVLFKFGTRAEYDSIKENARDNALYFLTDTGELLRGKKNLAQANHYEGIRVDNQTDLEVIRAATVGAHLIKNDTCIVKTLISGDKYSFTAYVYDGEKWCAMDGNYNAENVYFDQDLTFTTAVGYVSLKDGSATVPANGKNIKELFEYMFSKELDPSVTQPSATLSAPQNIAYEVGTQVTPTYSLSFSPGKYPYGPSPTGVTATYSVTDSLNSEAQNSALGSFGVITVDDDTNYTISATINYTQGSIPLTNLGNERENKRIQAGTITKTSGALTGYRPFFYGLTNAEVANSTSIRALTNGGIPVAQDLPQFEAKSVPNATKIIVALPVSSGLQVKKVILPASSSAEITSEFKLQPNPVAVNGFNSYTAADYNIWIYQPASLDQSENYIISLG